jgi:hypothetical protein
VRLAWVCLVAIACGGRTPPPEPPEPPAAPDARELALRLHHDLVALGELAARHRDDCDALITALRAHVEVMRGHFDEVKHASRDPAFGSAFEAEARTYEAGKPELTDAIANDLAAAYGTCRRDDLFEVIKQIPQW